MDAMETLHRIARLLGELSAPKTTRTVTPVRFDGTCTVCHMRLDGDPEDDPFNPGGALCGECFRAREFDEELWISEE